MPPGARQRRATHEDAAGAAGSGNGHDVDGAQHEKTTAIAELEAGGAPIDFDYDEQVPGYEPSASDCLNRALGIARSLNHTSLSADHLMLALTMEQNARRLLERVGDINALREMAMKQLGEMNWKFSRPAGQESQFPAQTSDLEDVRKMALHDASERGSAWAISDLINAFPHEKGRLTYGVRESFEGVPAVIERIESGPMPRLADFIARLQTEIRDAVELQVGNVLRDVAEPQLRAAVQRQLASTEEINRQFRSVTETQLTTLLREFSDKLTTEVNEPEAEHEPPVAMPTTSADTAGTHPTFVTTTTPPINAGVGAKRYWNWMALI